MHAMYRRFTMALIETLLLMSALALAGCSSVQPWEKQHLARPEMTFDYESLDTGYTEHVYGSKEGASGGSGVGGGGCGCN